jgi:hypothetical protein
VQVPGLEAFPFVINAGRVPAGRTFVIHTLYLVDTEVRQIELRVIGGGSGRPDPILVSSERPTNFTSGIAIAGGETLVLRRQDSDLSFVATVYIAGVLE